jgi:PAS domain S-box-containing protein
MVSLMSARLHAADLYSLKRDPVRRYVFALVLLFVVTTLLLSVTEATLRINIRQLDQALENQQARRELGQIILRELFKLEVILYQLPALRDDLDMGVLRGQFDTALTKIETVLGVLQRGGRFVEFRPTNFDKTNQISETIEYAGPEGGYVIAAIEITPKLIEIEQEGERIFARVESQMYEGRDLNTPLIPGSVMRLLKHLQPTLLRCRESANKIYYESVMAITAQKGAKQTAARWYAGIRVCVIGGIGLLGIVLCVRTLRRIGEIMDQRIRAELAMSEAHGNLELILKTLPVGVALIDSQKRVRSMNPAGLELLGYMKAEAVSGLPYDKIFGRPSDSTGNHEDDHQDGLPIETRLRRESGEKVAVIKKAIALKMHDETVFLEAFMDISARLKVETALRDQQHFTKTVLDFAPVGIVVIDAEAHRIIDINPAALSLFETDRSDAVNAVCHKFICPNKQGNCPITGQGKHVHQAECQMVSRKGRHRKILKSVVSTTLGGRQCLVESFVDISPLVEERRRAEAASRAKSDFLANMSHELRTPLNHIIGFTELVVDQHFGELNEVQAEYLSDVLTSGRHLLSLINDILDLSKVEAGNLALQPTVFDLTALLANSLVLVKEKALKHGIKVAFRAPPYAIAMLADERKIKQILYNLLANAVKFTPDGGAVDMSVNLSETQPQPGTAVAASFAADPPEDEEGWVLLCVQDTGIGLCGDDLKRIFKPFEQVDQSTERHYGGTGLGLSLTRQMVALHGGRIWAESDGENRGSRFYVSLPRQAPVAA